MDISQMIETNYTSVSILEDTRHIMEWLKENEFLAVVDEEMRTVGIVAACDMIRENGYQLIDCAFDKPSVSPSHSVEEVFQLMETACTAYLPIYDKLVFVGVIDLYTITRTLLQHIRSLEIAH
jgi:predicted transcriptional regulator